MKKELLPAYDQDLDEDDILDDGVSDLYIDEPRDNDYVSSAGDRPYLSRANTITANKRQANSGMQNCYANW